MASGFALALLVAAAVASFPTGARAESCTYNNGYYNQQTYCSYGCCSWRSDGCCESYTYNEIRTGVNVIGIVVGCVIGGIVLIASIIVVICCCVRRRGHPGQVMQPGYGQPIVATTTTSNNMAVSGVSGQYPMQPVGNPWYPQPQPYPQYPAQPAGPTGYAQPQMYPPPYQPPVNGYPDKGGQETASAPYPAAPYPAAPYSAPPNPTPQ